MIHLTEEQASSLRRQQEPQVYDPVADEVCFLVSSKTYQLIKELEEDQKIQAAWQGLTRKGRALYLKNNPPAP
jgi:hypothetical protein